MPTPRIYVPNHPMIDSSNKIPFHILLLFRCPISIYSPNRYFKRPGVTGTSEQAFSFVGDVTNTVVKLVQTKTISTLATVTPGSTTLQYLVNPQIHYDLTGTPTTIIGNESNKKENSVSLRLTPNLSAYSRTLLPRMTLILSWSTGMTFPRSFLGKRTF